jgi:parallel beta-helix repeat protein
MEESNGVQIILNVTGGNNREYSPKDIAVAPNSINVQDASLLNDLINNTDNTTFYIGEMGSLSKPILINTTEYKNNRAFIHIKPLQGYVPSLSSREEQDFVIAVDNSSNISISDLSIKNGKYGIIVENSSYVDLARNDIWPSYDDGIYIKRSQKCNILNNIIHINITDNESGITLYNSWENSLSGNQVFQIPSPHPTVIFNLTSNSYGNQVKMAGNDFAFFDSGYQCHYIGGTCNCFCTDSDLCNSNACNGTCNDCSNITGSRNKWHFSLT